MAGPRGLERLTTQDLLMLWADDFGWSEDIGVLAVLDGARLLDGDGRVRVDETATRKGRARPPMGGGLFGLVAVQRAWYRLLARQRTVNVVVTTVPGPPVPLYLAGARLLELFPVAAIMGNLTLAVAVLSYAGQLNLTAIADRDTCPRPGGVRPGHAGRPRRPRAVGLPYWGHAPEPAAQVAANARTALAANPSCPGRGVLRFQGWHERCGR